MVICRVWMIHKVSEALACEYESAAEGAYRPGHHGSDLDKAHHMVQDLNPDPFLLYILFC